jgi:hypothetical protein
MLAVRVPAQAIPLCSIPALPMSPRLAAAVLDMPVTSPMAVVAADTPAEIRTAAATTSRAQLAKSDSALDRKRQSLAAPPLCFVRRA